MDLSAPTGPSEVSAFRPYTVYTLGRSDFEVRVGGGARAPAPPPPAPPLPPPRTPPTPPPQVDSRYTDLKPVGRGAYGLVASAEDRLTGRKVRGDGAGALVRRVCRGATPHPHPPTPTQQVAIKRISRVFQDLVDAKRILREIKLLRHFGKHENVVEVLDIMTGPPDCIDFHTLYIVTQLYECDLERIVSSPQKLTDQHAQYFTYQVGGWRCVGPCTWPAAGLCAPSPAHTTPSIRCCAGSSTSTPPPSCTAI